MSQTKEGGKRTRETMIKRYGSEEAWKEHMRRIGSEGGKVRNDNKGFGGMDKEKVREAGRKGGSISKRGKSIDFKLAFEKEGDTKNLYDTSNLGVDGNTVHGAGGVLRRAVDRVVGK